MRPHTLRCHAALILLAATGAAFASAEPRGGEVVKLPRLEVKASRPDFEFDVSYDDVTTKVQSVSVTWVSPGTHKHGLRVGDRMTSIDSKQIGELTVEEFLAATKRKLAPGESQTLLFTGTRMLIRHVTITYTTKGPNKAPEPTTLLVTPRADARVAPSRVVAHL